ncbi:unnamed protein product [Sphenostylis stenocarpa]|uniref:Uncharacterized protein n=1 Tax=Sphenostylis stenocarpa TaxID=92480 RepID=A0AA86V842_9FABA|nr:unnamed protein product [Sphenostylis stenocarpa]
MEPHEKSFKAMHGPWKSLQKGTFPLASSPSYTTFLHNLHNVATTPAAYKSPCTLKRSDFDMGRWIKKVGPISCESEAEAVGGAHRILGEDVEGK